MLNAMSALSFWEGHVVESCSERPDGTLLIRLSESPDVPARCGCCEAPCVLVHERVRRQVRDRDCFDRRVWLDVPIRRMDCHHCGARVTERIAWLAPHARITRRLCAWVEALTQLLPIAHVAQLTGLHWHTIKQIDHARLKAKYGLFEARDVRRLVMDEFALHKGHRYATVVMDARTMRVLWVGEGNSRSDIRPFFEALGPEGCKRIEAVAMDMNSAFDLEVRHFCRQARVVYDLFHVVAKFGRDVISRVRVDAANQLRKDKPARRVVKQAHWLLLRNPANLDEHQRIRLADVLQANQALMTVYLMKESLKQLWSAPSAWEWRRRWKQWHAHAQESGIAPLEHFARCLRNYWRGIVSRVRWPMHTGQLEGINNRIKVIKRMAYGYRDTDYFFLKIKAAFPGNA